MKLNVVTLLVITIGLVFFLPFLLRLPWTSFHIAGAAIYVPALVLFVMARVQLGRAFSIQAKATTLVTTGLYSRIRNPIYVFGAAMLAGICVYTGKLWLLAVFLILIPIQVYRSRQEERVLAEKFGDAYVEYKQKTWF